MDVKILSPSSSSQNAGKAEKVETESGLQKKHEAEPGLQKKNEDIDSSARKQEVKEEKSMVKIDIFADDVVDEKKDNNKETDSSDNKANETNSVQVEST